MLFSSSPAAWRAVKWSNIFTEEAKRKPMNWFSLGYLEEQYFFCGRVRTTTTRSRNIAGMFQLNNRLNETCSHVLQHKFLVFNIHVLNNWHHLKQGIRWPKSRGHIVGSSLVLNGFTFFLRVLVPKYWCSIGLQVQVRSFYLIGKQQLSFKSWLNLHIMQTDF